MEEIIKEIAQLIDSGEVVFLHRTTNEILSHPSQSANGYSDEYDYLVQEVLDIVDAAPDSYIQFDPLISQESYKIMEGFIETITDERVKMMLLASLSGKRPFRRFRDTVQDEGIEDDWYDFRDAYLRMTVQDKLGEAGEVE